MTTSLETSMQ